MAGTELHAIEEVEVMLDLLRRQGRLFDRLSALADKQRALIANEDTQPLLRILAERQKLTGELEGIGRAMAPWRAEWGRARAALSAEQRAEVDALVEGMNGRLESLLQSDEEDARRLQVRKQRVGDELRATRSNRQALSAYGRSTAGTGSSFDRTHDES